MNRFFLLQQADTPNRFPFQVELSIATSSPTILVKIHYHIKFTKKCKH